MATQAQIAANRKNATRSTGPTTPAGRARSSRNALKSGIFAESEIIPGEDPAEFDGLKSRLYESLQPTAEEATLVDAVARADWQLRRFSRVEAQIWTDRIVVQKNPRTPLCSAYVYHPEFLDRLYRQQASTARTLRNSLETLVRLRKASPLFTSEEEVGQALSPANPEPPQTDETNPNSPPPTAAEPQETDPSQALTPTTPEPEKSAGTNPIPASPVPSPQPPVPESNAGPRPVTPDPRPRYRYYNGQRVLITS